MGEAALMENWGLGLGKFHKYFLEPSKTLGAHLDFNQAT